ncbi:hypothetical protein BDP27DRAFT_1423350 [Rhodocollybia butyracea]|uniref:Uncharacterized protein n=1 Tax=Rhodocollybia butyracea TaxID=206335 RepID=A0A9P5PP51_9AGAR|nr:hypothetical protein BDP27DRAFT_1423350 [Rhodocollybia butyracea]
MLCLLVATYILVTLYLFANLAINMVFLKVSLQDEVIFPVLKVQAAQQTVSLQFLEVGAQISNWTSSLIVSLQNHKLLLAFSGSDLALTNLNLLQLLIGDVTIKWRAWAVSMPSSLAEKLFLDFFCLESSAGLSSVNFADTSIDNDQGFQTTGQSILLDWAFFALSLTVNIALTLLIAYQMWRAMQRLRLSI